MRERYKEGFRQFHDVIRKNITTIDGLLRQSEELAKIIQDLDADKPNLKKTLDILQGDISTSIVNLIKQTNTLFDTYESLIEEVFGK